MIWISDTDVCEEIDSDVVIIEDETAEELVVLTTSGERNRKFPAEYLLALQNITNTWRQSMLQKLPAKQAHWDEDKHLA